MKPKLGDSEGQGGSLAVLERHQLIAEAAAGAPRVATRMMLERPGRWLAIACLPALGTLGYLALPELAARYWSGPLAGVGTWLALAAAPLLVCAEVRDRLEGEDGRSLLRAARTRLPAAVALAPALVLMGGAWGAIFPTAGFLMRLLERLFGSAGTTFGSAFFFFTVAAAALSVPLVVVWAHVVSMASRRDASPWRALPDGLRVAGRYLRPSSTADAPLIATLAFSVAVVTVGSSVLYVPFAALLSVLPMSAKAQDLAWLVVMSLPWVLAIANFAVYSRREEALAALEGGASASR